MGHTDFSCGVCCVTHVVWPQENIFTPAQAHYRTCARARRWATPITSARWLTWHHKKHKRHRYTHTHMHVYVHAGGPHRLRQHAGLLYAWTEPGLPSWCSGDRWVPLCTKANRLVSACLVSGQGQYYPTGALVSGGYLRVRKRTDWSRPAWCLGRASITRLVLWCQVQIVSHFVVLSTFCLRCYS